MIREALQAVNASLRAGCALRLRPGLPLRGGALAAAMVLLLVAGTRFAGALPIVDVYAGFDGFYRPGQWVPIVVTVNNQPSSAQKASGLADFQGVLTIPSDSTSDPAGQYLFTRNITVPAHSIQRFYLYAKFPESPNTAPQLELRTPNGRLLNSYPLSIQPLVDGNVLLVTVSKELAPLRLPPLPGVDPIMRANSPPERLPEQWWGYECVGAVILTKWSETYLRPVQEKALEQWLKAGGTLVILGGGNATQWKGGLMDSVLPGSVTKSERIRLGGDGGATLVRDTTEAVGSQDIVVSRLQPNLDAQVLAQVEGLPLLVRSHYGRGTVLYFALDFQNNADQVSRVFTPLWRAVIPYEPLTGTALTWRSDMRSNTQIVSPRAARPPNIFLIFLLLVGYVIAVGPLNFRFLSKRKKVEWAWFTVPAIVLLFSLLIYGIGALTKGGQLIVREASLVMGEANDSTATLDGLIGIFSPEKTRYQAVPEDPNVAVGESDQWSDEIQKLRRSLSGFQPVQIGRQSTSGLFGFAGSKTVVRMEDDKQELADLPLGQWDLGFVEAYGLVNLEGTVSADLTWYGDQVTGTIRNNTSKTIQSPVLYSCGFAYPLPHDLLPGDSFTLAKGQGVFPLDGNGLGWSSQPADVINRQVIGKKSFDSEDARLAAKTRSAAAFYQLNPFLTATLFPPRSGETWLIGFGDQSAARVDLSKKPQILTHSICYAIRLPVQPAKGNLRVARGEAHLEMLVQNHNNTDSAVDFLDGGNLELSNSSCVISATLPFEDTRARVSSVEVSLRVEPATNQDVSIDILDQQSSRWMEIPFDVIRSDNSRAYHITIQDGASRYVTPINGRVFLRLGSKRSPTAGFTIQRSTTTLTQLSVAYNVTVP